MSEPGTFVDAFKYKPEFSRAALLGVVFASTLFAIGQKEASATIEHVTVKPQEKFEFTYKDDETGQRVIVRFVGLEKFGKVPTKEHIESQFFEKIMKQDTQTPRVNYAILDQKKFDAFVVSDMIRSRERLGLSWSSMSDIKPSDLALMTGEMVFWNMRSRPDIAKASPSYNEEYASEIDKMPVDQLREGVCRHFSAKGKVYARTMMRLAHSPYLDGKVAVDEINSLEELHSWIIFYALKVEVGVPVVEVAFEDVFFPPVDREYFPISAGKINALYKLFDSVEVTLKTKLFHEFTDEEKLETLKALFLYQEQGKPKVTILNAALGLYQNSLADNINKNHNEVAEKIFLESHEYIKNFQSYGISFKDNKEIFKAVKDYYKWAAQHFNDLKIQDDIQTKYMELLR